MRPIIALLIIAAGAAPALASTTYISEGFTNTTASGWVFTSQASLTANSGIDSDGQGWLRLTDALNSQTAFVYYDTPISTEAGLVVSFDFVIWGTSTTTGDGFTLSLFDATATPGVGGFGGSLGYAQRIGGVKGLAGGIAGFGFDAFGNYSNPTEGRVGGPGYRKNAIAIRGSMADATRTNGYAYITGTTSLTGLSWPGVTSRAGATVHTVRITIPADKKISIEWKVAGTESWTTLIDEYACSLSCPDLIKIGFTAGTGSTHSTQEVRNLTVTSNPVTTSSGIDLQAYQASEGCCVEFVAYDVEQDGSALRLQLLDANGDVAWSGSVDAVAGDLFLARFLVPGLQQGQTYNFLITDEVGKVWSVPGVTVGAFSAAMTRATLAGTTLTFDSRSGHDYEIQWVDQLGGTWQTITNMNATSSQTSAVVAYPDPAGPSGFFRVLGL
jgi:hypothetical protein